MTEFQKKVYKVVSRIPKGKVLTYNAVAGLAGSPGAARAVGNLMKKNPYPKEKVPCHRVVKGDGTIGGYNSGVDKKISLLVSEGVVVDKGKVNLKKFLH